MYRRSRLAAWREARRLRHAVRVERQDGRQLVVSVHGEFSAQETEGLGKVLGELISYGPLEAHVDLAGTGLVAGIGELFAALSVAAQIHHTRVTVHRAGAEQRAALRRYGLDRLLLYSDLAP